MSAGNSELLSSAGIENLAQIKELFEYLPDVYFFAKNRQGQFIMANQIFVERCGEIDESSIIGKTDRDFFPLDRARLYIRDDNHVMETGESVVNRVELSPDRHLSLTLFITSKIPLRNSMDEIVGLAGIARDMERSSQTVKPFSNLAPAIEYIHENCTDHIEVTLLAQLAGMSLSQFERKFKGLFQLTPQQYILEIRLSQACRLMLTTQYTLCQIAQDSGFYDHSHFTRQFVKKFGITPHEYQQRHNF